MRVYFASYQGKCSNISTIAHAKNEVEKGSLDVSVEAFFSNKIVNYHTDNHGGCSRTQRMVGFEGNIESKSQ